MSTLSSLHFLKKSDITCSDDNENGIPRVNSIIQTVSDWVDNSFKIFPMEHDTNTFEANADVHYDATVESITDNIARHKTNENYILDNRNCM